MKEIKELRKLTGLTQIEFGKKLGGIPRRTIQDWEAGISQCPLYVMRLIEFRITHDAELKQDK